MRFVSPPVLTLLAAAGIGEILGKRSEAVVAVANSGPRSCFVWLRSADITRAVTIVVPHQMSYYDCAKEHLWLRTRQGSARPRFGASGG